MTETLLVNIVLWLGFAIGYFDREIKELMKKITELLQIANQNKKKEEEQEERR